MQAEDGSLYGLTASGTDGKGTIFRLEVASLRRLAEAASATRSEGKRAGKTASLPVVSLTATNLPTDGSAAGAGGTLWVSRDGDATRPLVVNLRVRRSGQGNAAAPAGVARQVTLPAAQAQVALPASMLGVDGSADDLKVTLLPGEDYTVGVRHATVRRSAQTSTAARLTLPGVGPITLATGTVSTWLGGTGVWSNASLWNGGIPDGTSADVYIDGGRTGVASKVTMDGSRRVGRLTLDSGDTLTLADNTNLYVSNAGGFTGSGTLTLNGTLNVGASAGGSETNLQFDSPLTLAGSGTVNLVQPSTEVFDDGSGDTLTIGAGITVQGQGDLGAGRSIFVNYGQILASGKGQVLTFQPDSDPGPNFTNSFTVNSDNTTSPAIVKASDGGTISFSAGAAQVNNQGSFIAATSTANTSTLSVSAGSLKNLSGNTLTGGTYTVAATGTAGGTARMSFGGTGEITVNAATVTLNGANAAFDDFNGLNDNQGSFSLLGQRSFTTPGSLKNEGTLVIDAGSTLRTQGDLTDSDTAALSIVIGGTATQGAQSPGVLNVNGNAHLAGTLALRFAPGATLPKATDVIVVGSIAGTAGGFTVNGSFANVANGQRLNTSDALGSFEVDYGPGAANPHMIILKGFGLPSQTAPPAINSALSVKGTVGQPFSYQITATNLPTSFAATPLPAGLSVNTATGVISGTPTTAGTTSVALTAYNGAGKGTATLTITIAASAPVITSALTASGTVGKPFSYQIAAQYNPTSYNATRLPPGLSVNMAAGLISGAPTAAGTFTTTLSATNGVGTGTATLTITVVPANLPAPVIGGGAGGGLTASGQVGAAFSYQIPASNSPTSYGATGLPAGLSVNTATGLISGTPTAAGTFAATVTATNSGGTGQATLTIKVAAAGPVITSATTATAKAGFAFTYTITASGNPTSFAARGLPAGLTLNPTTGVISGTPTIPSEFVIALSATGAAGTANATLTLTVAAGAPVLNLPAGGAALTANAGVPFTYQITASGNPIGYSAVNLPPGLSFDTGSGKITGTPTKEGNHTVNLSAFNAAGLGNGTLTIIILAGTGLPVVTVVDFGATSRGRVNTLGANPTAPLIQATDGNFYGTTSSGGAYGTGTIYRVDPTHAVKVLHSFNLTTEGQPEFFGSGLIQGTDGNLYGVLQGGPTHSGTIYRITLTQPGVFTLVHTFPAGVNQGSFNDGGISPVGTLALGQDGNLYGVTHDGGSNGIGVAFKVTYAGVFTVLYNFGGSDGFDRVYGLIQARDGNFYGPASRGGPQGAGYGAGTIIKMTPAGVVTTLHAFDGPSEGGVPGGLVLGSDGALYFTCPGFLYRLTLGGVLTTVHVFSTASEGLPNGAALIQTAGDGDFYGSTSGGSLGSSGLIYRVTPGGVFTPLHAFSAIVFYLVGPSDNSDGAYPQASLLRAKDGNFYGTAELGGPSGSGTVFELSAGAPIITSALTANGTAPADGKTYPFSYQITATGSPTSYAASGLPAGLTIAPATGVISGTPQAAGTYNVTIGATNAAGTTTATLVLTITAPRH